MYTTTTERKSFGELFWPQRKTFQAGGGHKSPIKTRKAIFTTEIFPLGTPFFLQRKVLHWSRAVYGFFFPVLSFPGNSSELPRTLKFCPCRTRKTLEKTKDRGHGKYGNEVPWQSSRRSLGELAGLFIPRNPTFSGVVPQNVPNRSCECSFELCHSKLSGTSDSQRDSRESIRANHLQLTPLFLYRVRPIRLNHSNFRFARITRFARIVRIDSCESRH